MNAHIAQHFFRTIIVLAILASLPTIQTTRADDPEAQGDTSDLFSAAWESVTLSITAYNPVERPDIDPLTRKNVITVSGNLHIPDANDLIAASTTHATAAQAFDEDGNNVRFDANAVVQEAERDWVLGNQAAPSRVAVHLDPNQACPTSLSELDFTIDALYGQFYVTIDLPVEVTENWIEVAPRYRVRVEEVNMADDVCHIVVKKELVEVSGVSRHALNLEGWESFVDFWANWYTVSDLDAVSHTIVVDTEGNSVWRGGSVTQSSDSSNGTTLWTSRFTLNRCEGTENLRIRHTLAMTPYEIPVDVALTEIPIPGL